MATRAVLAGLDVGTSSSKSVLYDLDGNALATGRSVTPWATSGSLGDGAARRVEMDPRALVDSALAAVSQAIAQVPDVAVAALGVTSMAESGVLVDRSGQPVAPVIAWHDKRDLEEVRLLRQELGGSFSVRTGLPLRAQWSVTKHRWQSEHDPAASRSVRRFNIAEWVVRSLGGDEGSDVSLASRTGWLDLAQRQPWPEALAWSGAREDLLPPLVDSGTCLGRVSDEVGPQGLHGAVLTTAGHDHQAAALGTGAAGVGDVLDSCGSAEALVRTVARDVPASDVAALTGAGITVGWHVLPESWALLGATEGGLSLQRTRTDPGGDWAGTLAEVTAQAHAVHRAMELVVGPHRRLVVTGGWMRDAAFMAAKRRAFGPLQLSTVDEAGARGAALLAGLAAGAYADLSETPGARLGGSA